MSTTNLATEDYQFLKEYIHRESGILLDDDKHYLLNARLTPVAEQSHFESLTALARALRGGPNINLRKLVVEAMTTHETLFFRDTTLFEALRSTILPKLALKRTRPLRIWSAASSSGQEAYSVGMICLDLGLQPGMVQILGTDLSTQILERARNGRFNQLEMNRGLPATDLVRHFVRDGLEWQVKEPLRKMARFEQFDLRHSMIGKGPFDLIFCRNVLIYFDIPTKKQILGNLRKEMVPGGYLVLGSAESTLNLDESFNRIQVGKAIFNQVPE